MQFCNYLVYGYAAINNQTFELTPLHPNLDIQQNHYGKVTELKRRFPQLRILLSVGGDKDIEEHLESNQDSKYLKILDETNARRAFVASAAQFLQNYGFDGLDLAWQFPKNYPKKVKSGIKKVWSTFKGWFTGSKVVDEKAEEHKQQFIILVNELKQAFSRTGRLLSLTVLPHVNSECKFVCNFY